MFICPNCQKKFKDGTVFCDACGTKLEEVAQICPVCGEKNSLKATSCQACGTSFVPESNAPSADKPHKKLPIKWIAAAAGAVVVVVVLAIVLINVLGGDSGSKKYNYLLYVKDDEIMFSNLSDDPQQVTSRLDSGYTSEYSWQRLYQYCYVSDDGNIIFYPDRIDENSDYYTIYYRELNDPNADPVKVATDVRKYTVSGDAAIVTYLKGSDDCLLYRYDRKSDSTEKIGSDVDGFRVSKDGETVYYWNDEGSLYVNRVGEERDKLDSSMSEFVYMTEDAETVYYLKDDSLYKKTGSEDKEKIASDVASVLKVYESGEIYFLKSEEAKSLKDYLYDDKKSQDASMEEPSSWDYKDDEDYKKAYKAYQAKLMRDYVRELIDDDGDAYTLEWSFSRLFYYNGSKAEVVTDGYEDYTTYASDEPVIIFQASGSGSANKVNLSELDFENTSYYSFDLSDLESLVKSALQSNATRYIAVEGEATALESKDASCFRITSDGESIYYLDNIPEGKEYGELFEITINKGTVGEPKEYDADVYRYSIRLLADDQLAYYKDVDSDDDNGELYVNKKRVDSDVALGVGYVKESDTLVYFVDWNEGKEMGTLKVYADGKATKVNDDVHAVGLSTTGDILYLYDYSTNYYKGDLYVYEDGSSRKIDMDVSAIIPMYDED